MTYRIPETSMIYVVWWPDHGVLKVGRAWKRGRIRGFLATGAELLMLLTDRPTWEEKAALAGLADDFDRAFAREWDSTHIIPRGRGFTECFRVAAHEVGQAIRSIYRGIARYGNGQAVSVPTRPVHSAEPAPAADRGEVDGRGAEEERRRPRPRAGEPLPPEGVDLAVRARGDERGDRGSSAAPRGAGLDRTLRGRRADLLRAGAVVVGVARPRIGHPGTASRTLPETFWNVSRRFLGRGERAGGERASARRERPDQNLSRSTTLPLLPEAPSNRWHSAPLPGLRELPREVQRLGDRAARQRSSRGGRRLVRRGVS